MVFERYKSVLVKNHVFFAILQTKKSVERRRRFSRKISAGPNFCVFLVF